MNNYLKRFAVGIGLVVLCLGLLSKDVFLLKSYAASPGESFKSSLAAGKQQLSSKQYFSAVKSLESAVKLQPQSCEAHLCLGQAYLKLKDYLKARTQLRAAIRVGKGSANAEKANTCLMQLPKRLLAPRTGFDTRMISRALGIVSLERGSGEEAKPTVLDFYASWCQPCKQLHPLLEQAKSQYGDRINFMSINVDDPNNDQVVDQFGVSPIPTIVFLNPEGEVVTYSIGFSGEQGLDTGLKKILARG